MNDFTVASFGKQLGVTNPTIWRMIRDGQLKAYKVRRAVRIPYSEYERLVSENKISAR